MTDDEICDFLEHRGIKGMKWGVRKARNESDRAKTFNKKARTPEEEAKRKAVKKDLLLAGGLLAGTAIVGILLTHHGQKKISSPQVPKINISEGSDIQKLMNMTKNVKMSEISNIPNIPKLPGKTKMHPPREKWIREFNQKQAHLRGNTD